MDFESIQHLGVNPDLFIINKCEDRYNQDNINHIIILHMKKENNIICSCGSRNIKSRGTKFTEFIHANTDEKNIHIKLYRHVYKCEKCNSYFKQANPFDIQGSKLTHSNDIEILNDLRDINNTYSSVARKYGVSTTYVQELFDKKVDIPRGKLPMVLAIDEVYNRGLTSTKYCCVLYAPIEKRLVDVLDCRHKDYLIDYFARIPQDEKKNVLIVTMDLYKNYKDVVNLCLPDAHIAADSFHVIKNLNDCFNNVRIRIMKKYICLKEEKSYYYWFFKKFWKLLLSNIKDPSQYIVIRKTGATMTIASIIETMLKVDDELKAAYELKELYREFNFTATIDRQPEAKFDALVEAFRLSGIKEYYPFCKLLLRWKKEIITSLIRINDWRVSNGNLERKNSDIKTLYKVSNGFRNFPRARNRILFSINKNEPIKATRRNKTNKYKGKDRKPYKTSK